MSDIIERDSKIRKELRRLALLNGGEIHPKAVVEAARDEDSPLHASFDWDDTHAAEQWRIHQARQLIRAVVVYEKIGKHSVPCRVFVSLSSDRTEDGAGYRLAATVFSDADQRAQLLADARAEMLRFKEKYRALNELAAVFAAMDEAVINEPKPEALEANA